MRRYSFLILIIAAVACCCATPAAAGPAEDQYAVAAGHYARGRWKLASDEFERFLADYPQHPQIALARFFLGEALMQQGAPAQARPHFVAFATAQPEHRYAPQAMFRRGECAYLTGDRDAARKMLGEFHAHYKEHDLNAYALPYLGDLALMQADAAAAQGFYTEALREHADSILADQCSFGLARALQMQHRFDDATRFYEHLIKKAESPLADDSLLQLGRLQQEREQHDASLATFNTLLVKYPNSETLPYAHYWVAMAHMVKEEWPAAISALEKSAVDGDHPLTPAVRFQLGEAFRRAGRLEDAAAHFQLVVDESPQSPWMDDATHGLLRLASDTDQHAAVAEVSRQFLKNHPASPLRFDVSRLLGRAQRKLEDFDGSIQTLSALLAELDRMAKQTSDAASGQLTREEAKSLAAPTRYQLGLAYVGAGKYAEADATIGGLSPDEQSEPQLAASVAFVRAAALMGQKKYADAVAPLGAYLRLEPNGPDANKSRAQLAVALAHTKKLDEAQRVYDQLAKNVTDQTEFLNTTQFLAEAAYAAGEKAWARELFATLAGENNPPEFREKGISGKAWCELDLKAPQRSADTFDQLLREFPDSPLVPQSALARARALEQAGEPDSALAMYSLVIQKHADTQQLPQALYRAAKLLDKLQQDKQAEAYLKRYISEFPQQPNIDETLYTLAWVLNDQQREEEAAAIFTQIHDDYKSGRYWPDATYRLAERAAVANDYERVAALVDEMNATGTTDNVLSHALYLKGQSAAKVGRWQVMAAPMQQLLTQFPNSPRAMHAEYWIAESLYRQGKYAESAERFALLARRAQGQTDTWLAIVPLRRAQALAHERKWAAAYAMAEKIAEEFPGFAQQYEADYLMGRCLANQARFADARAAYERVVTSVHGRRTETAAMAQWNIGETFFHQKEYEEAIKAYSRVELLYDFPRWQALSLLQTGKCYENLGQWSEAAARYEQIVNDFAMTDSTTEANRLLQTAREKARTAQNESGLRETAPPNPLDARGPSESESR